MLKTSLEHFFLLKFVFKYRMQLFEGNYRLDSISSYLNFLIFITTLSSKFIL